MRRFKPGTSVMVLVVVGLVAAAIDLRGYTGFGYVWRTTEVPYYVNPQNMYVSPAAALAAVQAGASAWSEESSANIRLVYAGPTSGSSVAYNGKNEVFFRNDPGGSVVGQTTWWASTSGQLLDTDIVFFQDHQWTTMALGCTSGLYIENTAAHEFGHALGLEHSDVGTATMWPSTGTCETIRASLDTDDIAGIQALYPPTSTNPAPSAPTQLGVTTSNSNPTGSLNVTWGASSNASGYRLERSADGSTFGQIAQLGSSTLSYVDNGLSSGTVYYYRVRAFNSAGSSGYSNIAWGQTQQANINTAPTVTISSPSNGGSLTQGTSINFSGAASDSQDGNLTSRLAWTSNLDGSLGTGGGFSRTLTAGSHVITAAVVDSGGYSGAAQVSITVSAPSVPLDSTVPSLTATGYKVKGAMKVDLTWSGFTASTLIISRDNVDILATPNDGAETDQVNRKGNGYFIYRVCTIYRTVCSNPVAVAFR